jgi:hypothetical protein
LRRQIRADSVSRRNVRRCRLEIIVRHVSARTQHRGYISAQVSVCRNLVVERLIGNLTGVDLNALLLQAIGQLGL